MTISSDQISATSSMGFSIANTPVTPTSTPPGLLATRAVQTKAGWVGQILLDKTIVWESAIILHQGEAVEVANKRVIRKLSTLFAED